MTSLCSQLFADASPQKLQLTLEHLRVLYDSHPQLRNAIVFLYNFVLLRLKENETYSASVNCTTNSCNPAHLEEVISLLPSDLFENKEALLTHSVTSPTPSTESYDFATKALSNVCHFLGHVFSFGFLRNSKKTNEIQSSGDSSEGKRSIPYLARFTQDLAGLMEYRKVLQEGVAGVHQRGRAIKKASSSAIYNFFDEARYIWAYRENPFSHRLLGVGLLGFSTVLLTISSTSWNAALVCNDMASQPARA
jgi:hypothetical protein